MDIRFNASKTYAVSPGFEEKRPAAAARQADGTLPMTMKPEDLHRYTLPMPE